MVINFNDTPISCDNIIKSRRAGDNNTNLSIQISEDIKDDQYYIGLLRDSTKISFVANNKEENYQIVDRENSSYSVNYTDTEVVANINLFVE